MISTNTGKRHTYSRKKEVSLKFRHTPSSAARIFPGG
jgi:hypothetical protein